eukprot:GILI01018570.1.p1 GENE.GILI01018570.1~~GILI01018570.1.p1  ORF type:complete len:637 (-),score=140.17 GILI01018570.1:323-2233(-)
MASPKAKRRIRPLVADLIISNDEEEAPKLAENPNAPPSFSHNNTIHLAPISLSSSAASSPAVSPTVGVKPILSRSGTAKLTKSVSFVDDDPETSAPVKAAPSDSEREGKAKKEQSKEKGKSSSSESTVKKATVADKSKEQKDVDKDSAKKAQKDRDTVTAILSQQSFVRKGDEEDGNKKTEKNLSFFTKTVRRSLLSFRLERLSFWADWCSCAGLFGLVLQVASLETSKFNNFEEMNLVTVIQVCVTLSTIATLFGLFRYHFIIFKMESHGSLTFRSNVLHFLSRYSHLPTFILEFLACGVHVPPFLPDYQDRYGILILLRLFLPLRSLFHHDRLASPGARIVCSANSIYPGVFFLLKYVFRRTPSPVVMCLFLLSIMIGASALDICEWRERRHFVDYMWLTVITSSSVGYGDLYAVSACGRVVSVTIALAGTAIFSLLTGLVANILILNRRELNVITTMQSLEELETINTVAMNIIKTALKLHLAQKRWRQSQTQFPELRDGSLPRAQWRPEHLAAMHADHGVIRTTSSMNQCLEIFRQLRRKQKAREDPEEQFNLFFAMRQMKEDVIEVQEKLRSLNYLLSDLIYEAKGLTSDEAQEWRKKEESLVKRQLGGLIGAEESFQKRSKIFSDLAAAS